MDSITVKTSTLIGILEKNRNAHRALFLKAQEGFRKDVIEQLDSMLADARARKKIRIHAGLAEPQDHTDDYDRVIGMLKLTTQKVVELDEHQYQNYVQDNWGWSASANVTNTYYATRAG